MPVNTRLNKTFDVIVYHESHLCTITIEPHFFVPGYHVVLDGDHETSIWCDNLDEAESVAEDMLEQFEADNGQFGVGA